MEVADQSGVAIAVPNPDRPAAAMAATSTEGIEVTGFSLGPLSLDEAFSRSRTTLRAAMRNLRKRETTNDASRTKPLAGPADRSLRRTTRSSAAYGRESLAIFLTTLPNCLGNGPVLYGIPKRAHASLTSTAISE